MTAAVAAPETTDGGGGGDHPGGAVAALLASQWTKLWTTTARERRGRSRDTNVEQVTAVAWLAAGCADADTASDHRQCLQPLCVLETPVRVKDSSVGGASRVRQ